MSVADREIVEQRLASQLISTDVRAAPHEVVQWMTAMQGQDLASVTWSIGLRCPGSIVFDVESAFTDGVIVRSWPLRGTLHVVAAEDLSWMLSLTSERTLKGSRTRRAALGLSDEHLKKAQSAAHNALGGGRMIDRDRLYQAFTREGLETSGQRGYHLIWFLAHIGVLCLGPCVRGKQVYVLVDEWITTGRSLERDEALGELVVRYFRSHGPASIRDFAWWSSLTLADARVGLAIAAPRLEKFSRDGEDFYFDPSITGDTRDRTRLLPGFDEYLLGYQKRSPQLDPDHAALVVPGGNGMFLATVVEHGRVVGTWKKKLKAPEVSVEIQRFSQKNSRQDDEIKRASAEYARFLGYTLT